MYIRILILLLLSVSSQAQTYQYLATPLRVTDNRGYFMSDSGNRAFTPLDTISATYLGAPDKIGDARLKNDTPYVRTSTQWLRLNTGAGGSGPAAYLYPTAPLSATVTIIKDQAATNSSLSLGTLGATITTNALGVTPTTTSGLALENTTAAALGAQQITPGIHFRSFGWGTTASTSQAVNWDIDGLPVQSTVPTGTLVFKSSIAGGAFAERMAILSDGSIRATRYLGNNIRELTSGNNYIAITGTTPNQAIVWGNSGILTHTFTSKATTGTYAFDNPITMTVAALGVTPGNGLTLANSTAAALGAQQISPPSVWSGFGWGTTASTSQAVKFQAFVLPVQSTVPTGTWQLQASIAGGAFANVLTVRSSDGNVVTPGNVQASGGLTAAGSNVVVTSGGVFSASSNTSNYQTNTTASTITSGSFSNFISTRGFAPTSGTGEYNLIAYTGTINQTGGANGAVRGVYFNPTVTAAADLKAFESTNTTGKSIVTASAPSTFGGSVQTTLLKLPNTGGAATAGTATLVAGTVTVNTTAMTATALLFLQRKTAGGTIGFATTYTQVNNTSFTINSDNILDTSTFVWKIIDTY